MDAIMECSSEINNQQTETCKVYDESNCVKQCNDNCNENHNPAENIIDSIKAPTELTDQCITELNPNISDDIVNNLFPENGENPEVKKFIEPVSEENVQSADQVANKANSTSSTSTNSTTSTTSISNSNKRKADSLIDSNIEEKKNFNMRKNIRGVLSENDFDTITIAAQREESERLARVQELKKSVKQRIIFTPSQSKIENAQIAGAQNEKCFLKLEYPQGSQPSRLNLGQIKLQRIEDKRVRRTFNQWCSLDRVNKVDPDENDEVVTIDSSSEDDCIILSDSDEDCLEDDADEDHHNSGLHVRDVLNIPDEHGKVLVNVGHVDGEPDIYMAPQIAKIIKPHQIGGVRFLFDNIIESTKRFNNSSGFGCILAHSMGLGKTLQVVCFCDIFLRHTEAKTVLCVMPINTIQNWMNEFNMWLPKDTPNQEQIRPRNFNVFALTDQHKTMTARANVILQWSTEGGVLLIGYELFRVLGLKIVRKKESKRAIENDKRLSEQIYTALVKPGPDLVICDEGHRIKNAHAGISLALKQIRSRRRIVLTGYPLQNNLLEYWCMVDFVRPNYLGSKTEFCNMFERPIQNGQCIDSTPEDIKLMRYRAHVLHSLLVGFVQRRSDSVLQNSLPQKLEYVVLTKMTPFQKKLYDAFMNEVVRKKKVPNPLKAFAVCCKIWNHPDVLYKFLKKREFDYDLDIEEQEAIVKANATSVKPIKAQNENDPQKDYPNATSKTSTDEPFYLNNCEPIGLHSNLDAFASKENPNAFWQDAVTSVTAQAPKPDYVGLIAKSNESVNDEDKSKCSSQIVDLDTKEVQFINSDINTNLEISTTSTGSVGSVKAPTKVEPEPQQATNLNVKVVKNEVKAGSESIPYDWAYGLIKDYEPGLVSNSPKMQIFFYILEASIKMGDRVLVFSQSLLTLNLIEFFLQTLLIPESQNYWKKNVSYFRLDGSTNAFERERLVTEFNRNTDVKLFLISTRAGSLGINLTGANRVVVFDASWNPCHDTQAVHRIYRYGQRKSCFVYRIVMDNCMEKNIYDRQVKKQGMSDRVVDECNPDAHLSIRELTNLCYDKAEEGEGPTFTQPIENYTDIVMRNIITDYKSLLSKEPFYHESLLIDRKDKKLSQTEKKLAKRAYEIEKKASAKPTYFMPTNIIPNRDGIHNPVFNQPIRQKFKETCKSPAIRLTRWIPAEVWQRQGMTSQEMTLPVDVAIPTNSSEASNIVVKAGEKVMILKSPKGVYMQLENGKIIAIKTSGEGAQNKLNADNKKFINVLDATSRRKDIRNVRIERSNAAESDKDDVIVIDDNMSDSPETSGDSTYSKSQPESNTNKEYNSVAPQVFRNKPNVIPETVHKEKPEAILQHHFNKEKPETITQHHFNKDKPESMLQHHFNKEKPETIMQQHHFNKEKPETMMQQHHFNKEKPETMMQQHHFNKEKPETMMQQHHFNKEKPETLMQHHHYNNEKPEAIMQHLHFNKEKPETMIQHHYNPTPQVFANKEDVTSNGLHKDKPETLLQTHQKFDPQSQIEPPLRSSYVEKHCNTYFGDIPNCNQTATANIPNNPAYNMPPSHTMENQHIASLPPNQWDNKSPELFKQSVKISNIPAPYPSTAISDMNAFDKNANAPQPQPTNNMLNVDQYPNPYTQQCTNPDENVFHHTPNPNLNTNYYSNSLPTTSTENNASLNALYRFNNKNETNYSDQYFENSSSSHSNYHQQISKYSYDYYQPQYLPNFSNKAYDNNAYASFSSQSYMRRPSTYFSSPTNGVDVGLNYTEPQGWVKKHHPG